jgi:hypothetical protein
MINGKFIECVRKKISDKIVRTINCTIPGLKNLLDGNISFPQCTDFKSANPTHHSYQEMSYDFLTNEHFYGCQMPCTKISYKTFAKHYHKSNWFNFESKFSDGNTFILGLAFSSLDVESRVETLVYDTGSMLAAAGGYLGLFLGFSCLTCLTSFVDLLTHFIFKIKAN